MKTNLEPYNLHARLHVDVLREKYGRIDVQVLYDEGDKRAVLLMDKDHIARTYAITLKSADSRNEPGIREVNDAIRSGGGIGTAFKDFGFDIQKNVLDVYVVQLPTWLQETFRTDRKTAKARITEFMAKKGRAVYHYGIVIEIYSPDFRKPRINDADRAQINIPVSVLQSLGFTKEEIWASLKRKIIAPYLAKLYSPVVDEIKKAFTVANSSSHVVI